MEQLENEDENQFSKLQKIIDAGGDPNQITEEDSQTASKPNLLDKDAADEDVGEMRTEAGDEDEELFSSFTFRSFKTQKLVEEDYELINLKDPEQPTKINV